MSKWASEYLYLGLLYLSNILPRPEINGHTKNGIKKPTPKSKFIIFPPDNREDEVDAT